MSIEFRRSGRKVSKNQLFKGLEKDIGTKAEQHIESDLARIIDPETGRPVKYEKTYRNGEPQWNLKGSPEAVKRAKRALKK